MPKTQRPHGLDTSNGDIQPFNGIWPKIADDVFLASGTRIIGDVEIGAGSSIWYNCVLRGDVNHIRIGKGTNIQDGSVIHVSHKTHPTLIGDHVLVGHMAMLHGCILHNHSFIGLGTIVMDGCVIEEDGMLAAGSLLAPGKIIKAGDMWMGRPARFVRRLDDADIKANRMGAPGYAGLAQIFRSERREKTS